MIISGRDDGLVVIQLPNKKVVSFNRGDIWEYGTIRQDVYGRKFWIKQELKVLREQNRKLRKAAWQNFISLQERDYRARQETGALDGLEVRLTYDERQALYKRAATALYGSP